MVLARVCVSRYERSSILRVIVDAFFPIDNAPFHLIRTLDYKIEIRSTYLKTFILGAVSCGVPTLEEEYAEEYVSLPVSMFGNGTFFLLRANGESMIDAGISPGDLVLVRKQSEAMDGDIVVALVGNENTLKRYFVDKENQKIRLHPENKTMKDIIVSDCEIQGVAVKVIKDLA